VYVALHIIARSAPAHPTNPSELGLFAGRQLLATVAVFLQYILPLALLLGAAASFIRRRHGARLLAHAAVDPTGSIDSLSWRDFERLVGESYERQGFTVTRTGGGGADGGVDLVLTKGRETTLVQCKQWRAQKVGVATLRELYGVMAAKAAACGIVVSAGDFTSDAREFARGRNIELLTGRALTEVLGAGSTSQGVRTLGPTPVCPKCGSRMVERTARQGRNAGQSFWGCESYPRCRVTLPIAMAR
jgi:restriction system protein